MSEQEELMDNLLNLDLEIIDAVRDLHKENWNSNSLKEKVENLLKIRDEMVVKLMSFNGNDHSCDCGDEHNHDESNSSK